MSPAISITRSSCSDWAAIGADSTVTCASANGSRLSPWAPTARTRRRPESYRKISARRMWANRHTASHKRS